MKKLFVFAMATLLVAQALSQAKKPTIMVMPSDAWCNKNGYMITYNNQGSTVKRADYKMAFQENTDLLLMTSKINELMAERGFPLKNLESVLKSIETSSAENDMLMSKESGMGIAMSPYDQLKEVAKADIVMQVTWTVNTTGPKKSITFNLQGLDAYTNKQIASASGTGEPSFSAELPVLLEEAVLAHLDNFNASLMAHFEDLFENGREVHIRVQRWDDWEEDLESYFGPNEEELGILIEDWMFDNTVQGRFNTSDATENMMLFEQVRIPLFYERNGRERALDTRTFAQNLSRHLRASYGIESKVTTQGLGGASVILGSK